MGMGDYKLLQNRDDFRYQKECCEYVNRQQKLLVNELDMTQNSFLPETVYTRNIRDTHDREPGNPRIIREGK
jgi:hypothetical protein